MKKIIITLFTILLLNITISVNAGGSANFSLKPDKIDIFNIEKVNGDNIKLSWEEDNWSEDFVDYILLRSKQKEKLNYPSDYGISGLKFITNKSVTSFIDNNPLTGNVWYRLCVVTKAGGFTDGKINLNVRCSDKKTISQTTQIEGLSSSMQAKIDRILEKFFKKVEKKIKSDDKKIKLYKKINSKINKIKKRASKKKLLLLNYIQKLITKKIDELSFGDIEDILIIDNEDSDSDSNNNYYYNLNGKKFIGGEVVPYFNIKIDGNQLSFQKELNGEIKNYTITATKFNDEITFETTTGPYFVFKEEICNMAMGGFSYYYSAYVYEGGEETFAGCASPVKDFSISKYSGMGKDNTWSFSYENGVAKLLKNSQTINYNVELSQIGEGFVMTSTDEKFSINFRPNICSFEDDDSQLYAWTIDGYINGDYVSGCSK